MLCLNFPVGSEDLLDETSAFSFSLAVSLGNVQPDNKNKVIIDTIFFKTISFLHSKFSITILSDFLQPNSNSYISRSGVDRPR